MHVFPELQYGGADSARAAICHDEWIALHHRQEWAPKEWRETLQKRITGSSNRSPRGCGRTGRSVYGGLLVGTLARVDPTPAAHLSHHQSRTPCQAVGKLVWMPA